LSIEPLFGLPRKWDAAQERGEIAGHGGARNFNVPSENAEATAAQVGVTRKFIFEARQIRDAEEADPGIVRRTLDEQIECGAVWDTPQRAGELSAIRLHDAS